MEDNIKSLEPAPFDDMFAAAPADIFAEVSLGLDSHEMRGVRVCHAVEQINISCLDGKNGTVSNQTSFTYLEMFRLPAKSRMLINIEVLTFKLSNSL